MEWKSPLLEAAMRPGTVVGWTSHGSEEVGTVVGVDGRDVLVVSIYSKSLENDVATKQYRDAKLTAALPPLTDTALERDVHRIPRAKVRPQGALKGRERSVYDRLGVHLKKVMGENTVRSDFKRLAGA